MACKSKTNKTVLVGVLKNKRDLKILLGEKWYRAPVAHCPKIKFNYLAFYQPAIFGREGKRINYYARILNYQVVRRRKLLPNEPDHLRANDLYFKFKLAKIKKLTQPVRNIYPRRISFGLTTLSHLLRSKDILQLYDVAPTEQIVEDGLTQAGIRTEPQHWVTSGGRRYRLDLAIFCKNGSIAVECDNKKAHSGRIRRKKDKTKNAFLISRGWIVIRLKEKDIICRLPFCLAKIRATVKKLGGLPN